MPSNPWIAHVKQYHAKHPNLSYKQAMQQARASYRPQHGKGLIEDIVKTAKSAFSDQVQAKKNLDALARRGPATNFGSLDGWKNFIETAAANEPSVVLAKSAVRSPFGQILVKPIEKELKGKLSGKSAGKGKSRGGASKMLTADRQYWSDVRS